MRKRIIALLVSLCVSAAALTGCGPQNDISSGAGAQDFPVTIGSVTLKAQPAGVAVLSGNLADVILTMNYEVSLKAKSADCTQSDLSVLPTVTANDAQQMKQLGVDLLMTDTDLTAEQSAACSQQGITVLKIARATGREDLDRLYSQVGSALKGAKTGYEKGVKISQSIFLTIDDINRVIPQSDTITTAAYLYDLNGGAVTGDTLNGRLMESAGLVNAADDATENKFPLEELLRANPKYIFCPTGLKVQLMASPEYSKLAAVTENRVYEMDSAGMQWQGRGMIEAVSFMAGTVYPELLKGTATTSTPSSTVSSAASKPSGTSSQTVSSGTPASSSTVSSASGTLQKGDKGDEVMKMQNRLKDLGYMYVKPTGEYVDTTVQIVKDFQFLNSLPATGIADAKTLALLYSDSAKKRTN